MAHSSRGDTSGAACVRVRARVALFAPRRHMDVILSIGMQLTVRWCSFPTHLQTSVPPTDRVHSALQLDTVGMLVFLLPRFSFLLLSSFLSFSFCPFPSPNRSFWEWRIPPAAIRRVLRACLFALAWLCFRHADTWM